MSAATFPGSALLPALSPSSNLVVRYCLISSVNRTAWLHGLCKAQPSCKSLQEAEASFLSRCSSVCATGALPISSLFSTVWNFSTQPLLSLSYTPFRSRCVLGGVRQHQDDSQGHWISWTGTIWHPVSEHRKRSLLCSSSLDVALWIRASLTEKKCTSTTRSVGPWGLTIVSW